MVIDICNVGACRSAARGKYSNVDVRFAFIVDDWQYINTFIYEMGLKESNLEKRKKIGELELRDSEWERVKLFLDLLAVSSIYCRKLSIIN